MNRAQRRRARIGPPEARLDHETAAELERLNPSPSRAKAGVRKSTKPKPMPGHKCRGASFGVRVSCECGWVSGTWYGQGARSNAYGEWQGHVAQHAKNEQRP
jgi:hypothetical protein